MDPDHSHIETYAVGLFSDIKHGRVKYEIVHYLIPQAKRGNWRAVRNYFNGYLSEWSYPPVGVRHSRCGRGWTRGLAQRSLMRHILAEKMEHTP